MTQSPALARVSALLAAFRWLFMPLGLWAALAVGIHGAAYLIDDRILWGIEQLDAGLDAFWSRFEFTQAWVDAIGLRECTFVARAITLLWELFVGVALGLPMLGYRELTAFQARARPWRDVFRRLKRQPTPMRMLRPVLTGIFATFGAVVIARMLDGALFLAVRASIAPDVLAGPLARVAALSAFALVFFAFGTRAVMRALQHADQLAQQPHRTRAGVWLEGTWGSLLALPLGLAAVADAAALISLFR
jgi:hypothetical protein